MDIFENGFLAVLVESFQNMYRFKTIGRTIVDICIWNLQKMQKSADISNEHVSSFLKRYVIVEWPLRLHKIKH